jgi:hypothetical protein
MHANKMYCEVIPGKKQPRSPLDTDKQLPLPFSPLENRKVTAVFDEPLVNSDVNISLATPKAGKAKSDNLLGMDTNEYNVSGRASCTEEERRELIEEFKTSGLTQAAFCR